MLYPQVMPGRLPLSLMFNQGQGAQAPAMPYAARPTLPMGGGATGGILSMLMQRRAAPMGLGNPKPVVPPAFGMGTFGGAKY